MLGFLYLRDFGYTLCKCVFASEAPLVLFKRKTRSFAFSKSFYQKKMGSGSDMKVGGTPLECADSRRLLAHREMGPWEGRTVLRTGRRAKDPIYQSDSQLKSRSAKSAKTKFFAPKCHYLRGDFFNNTTKSKIYM